MIRAADAAGCDAVIFVDDCVDVLNPKVIRSTAGSLFHLPVLAMSTDEFFTWTGDHNMDVWAADVYGTEERKPESLPAVLAGQGGGRGSESRAGSAMRRVAWNRTSSRAAAASSPSRFMARPNR